MSIVLSNAKVEINMNICQRGWGRKVRDCLSSCQHEWRESNERGLVRVHNLSAIILIDPSWPFFCFEHSAQAPQRRHVRFGADYIEKTGFSNPHPNLASKFDGTSWNRLEARRNITLKPWVINSHPVASGCGLIVLRWLSVFLPTHKFKALFRDNSRTSENNLLETAPRYIPLSHNVRWTNPMIHADKILMISRETLIERRIGEMNLVNLGCSVQTSKIQVAWILSIFHSSFFKEWDFK